VVVIPDVAAIASPGQRAESRKKGGETAKPQNAMGGDGLRGIKALGARDLTYRLAFLANSVKVVSHQRDLVWCSFADDISLLPI
jgi:DNA replication licensing factor MCM6